MNRIVFFLFVFLPLLCCAQPKTSFYKLTKTVSGNNTTTNVTGGQFITFVGSICFESDSKGVGIGHGNLHVETKTNGQITYSGGSYWGKESKLVFSSDLSEMSVVDGNGSKYFYTRSSPPSGQTTCSLRINRGSSGGGGTPIVTPIPGGSIEGGSISPVTPIGGQEANPRTPSKRWKNVRRTIDCDRCHHSGKCQTCNGKGWYQGTYGPIDCPNCDGYKTGRCSKCHGSGTIEKIEQVFE